MKRWVFALIPLVILVSLIAWRIGQKKADRVAEASQQAARKQSAPLVSVSTAQVRDLVQTFDATGSVEAPLNVKIASKITGRIEYLQVREGDRVSKGQVLVRIDPSEVEAQVRQAAATVAEAKYRLAQAQLTQNSTSVGINSQVRQQKAAVASAQADFTQVQENYKAQLAAAEASVTDMQGRIDSANASIANAQAAINSAKANLENARAKYNRISGLYKQGFVAAQEVDDAKAALSVQEAAVEVAQGQLKAANAQHNSAIAQKRASEQQASIVKTKGIADIEASRAILEQAQASSDYAQANTSQKSAYLQSIAALRSGVESAEASLRSAQARRSDTVLVAPMDGFVTGRYADPGAVITAGQPAVAVQFMRQVWVTTSVPEEITPKLHIGQSARIAFDAFPGKSFTGSIIQINPSADPQSRQFTVRVIMDNRHNRFKPGMFAHVSLTSEHIPGAIVVPREAVQTDDSGQYLVVVNQDNKAEHRTVVTGASDSDSVSVTQGLQPGEKIVITSTVPVRDGQSVRTGDKRGGRGEGRRQK